MASMYQNVQTLNAFSGAPKSSVSTYLNTWSPRRSSRSTAATVPLNRGYQALQYEISCMSSNAASISLPPKGGR